MRYLWSLPALLLALPALAQPTVTATLGELSHRPGTVAPHVGHDGVSQSGSLNTGSVTYTLQYNACWDQAHGTGSGTFEGYLGMPGPSSANWYHSGFLGLKINGLDLGATRLSDFWVAERGSRGSLKLYWDTPQAGVTVSFVALPGDDRLFCGIALNPRTEIRSLSLRLTSYPSYFTYWNKRDGDRKLTTALATYSQQDGKQLALQPSQEPWLALYDTVFDPAKGEGDGGCAVALLPEQVTALRATVGSYACPLELDYRPETRLIRLCFWDFNKHGNAESLAKLKGAAGPTLEQLRGFDFAPLALTGCDVTGRAAAAVAQLGKLPGAETLLGRLRTQSGELTALQQRVREGLSPTPAADESALLRKLTEFEQLLWEVKFFVLISG